MLRIQIPGRPGLAPSIAFAIALGGILACSDDSSTPPPVDETGSIRLRVSHEVNGEPLTLESMTYQNAADDTFSVQRLEYYICDIHVVGDETYDFPGAYYISATDASTREILLTGIPEGHYMTIDFTFGLTSELNHNGALPSTENNRAMEWPDTWGGGYHYMRIEGRYLDDGRERGYVTHSGRFADVTRPAEHHFFPVTTAVHRNVLADETLEVDLVMEILEWYESPNTIPLSEHGLGIMDNFDAQVRLQQNGAEGLLFEARTPAPREQ